MKRASRNTYSFLRRSRPYLLKHQPKDFYWSQYLFLLTKVKTRYSNDPLTRVFSVAIPIPSYEGQDYEAAEEQETDLQSQYLFLLTKVKTRELLESGLSNVQSQYLFLLTKVKTI